MMNPIPYIDEDLQALQESARRFAEERVKPGFLERDQTRVLDRALLREMGELGFICPELPEAFGGLGLGTVAAGVIHEEIARADLSFSYLNLLPRSTARSCPSTAIPRWSAPAAETGGGRGHLRHRSPTAHREAETAKAHRG